MSFLVIPAASPRHGPLPGLKQSHFHPVVEAHSPRACLAGQRAAAVSLERTPPATRGTRTAEAARNVTRHVRLRLLHQVLRHGEAPVPGHRCPPLSLLPEARRVSGCSLIRASARAGDGSRLAARWQAQVGPRRRACMRERRTCGSLRLRGTMRCVGISLGVKVLSLASLVRAWRWRSWLRSRLHHHWAWRRCRWRRLTGGFHLLLHLLEGVAAVEARQLRRRHHEATGGMPRTARCR